ncbi:hypothetical protein KFU94_70405, partial [Chloroflexi bacterium TSY]|nr:hypothetical protein [Chloroflexi bacterium TSY]
IWEDVLKRKPIGVTDYFFDIGGHSLLAVRLMAQIKQVFDRELPLATLFQATTIEQFAQILQQEGDLVRETLVPIQPHGSQPPFFCVHAIGGEVLNFVDLATHLGTEQPFYGLQAPTLAEANGAEESIKEMAARYINVICEAFPEGPYLLGGLCYGGTIAFEMARQLRALGKEVALLALIDSWSPAVLPSPQDDAERFVEQALYLARINGKTLDLTPSMLQSLSPDEQLELMLARVKEAGLLPPEIELDWLRRYIRGYKERSHAFRQYTPEGYAGPVTLFRPRQRDLAQMESFEARGLDMQDVAQGWSAATQGVVNTIIVPGYHETMCHEPHVQTLAAELNHCIQDALMMPLEASTYLN